MATAVAIIAATAINRCFMGVTFRFASTWISRELIVPPPGKSKRPLPHPVFVRVPREGAARQNRCRQQSS